MYFSHCSREAAVAEGLAGTLTEELDSKGAGEGSRGRRDWWGGGGRGGQTPQSGDYQRRAVPWGNCALSKCGHVCVQGFVRYKSIWRGLVYTEGMMGKEPTLLLIDALEPTSKPMSEAAASEMSKCHRHVEHV